MQPTELDFKGYLNLIRRRKELFLVLTLLIMTLIFAGSYLLPRKYEASSTVFIERNILGEMVKGITVPPPVEDTINVLTYALTSRWLVSKAADSLDLCGGMPDKEREDTIKTLQEKTTVKVKDRNLFTISYTGSDATKARDFVNTLVRIYIDQNSSANLGQSHEASTVLSQQLSTFKTKLERSEQRVSSYKTRMGRVITLDEGQVFEEIAVARQKLDELQLRRRQLEETRRMSQGLDDPLQVRLTALQKRLGDLLTQYTESYPEVIMVRSEIDTVKEQLRTGRGRSEGRLDDRETVRLDAEIRALKAGEEGLRRDISRNNGLLSELPSAKAGLEKMEMELQNDKRIYEQLLARQGQSEVSSQMGFQDKTLTFRVVDPAILPVKPVSPKRFQIMLMGILVALGGSFGLMLLLERLDGSVKDQEFVKGLGAPVLAVIPLMHDPAAAARKRRRSLCVFLFGTVYLLFMLCFPVLELLGVPYMDKLVDQLQQGAAAHAGKTPAR